MVTLGNAQEMEVGRSLNSCQFYLDYAILCFMVGGLMLGQGLLILSYRISSKTVLV